MKRTSDQFGLEFTVSNEESVGAYHHLIAGYLGHRPDTGNRLKALLKMDAAMPMARCAQGYLAKLMGSAEHSGRARHIVNDLKKDGNLSSMVWREQQHVNALSKWCDGQLEAAAAIWESILIAFPMDSLAIRLAHSSHFYTGDGRRMRDSLARVLPFWNQSHPHYGFLLGMYAFGLGESGQSEQAESFGKRGVELNGEDAWSIHAVAHVYEMTGQHQKGVDWVRETEPGWSGVNNFRFHLRWHQCLYYLELGDYASVLGLYDEYLVSDLESGFYLDVCNATSLLWRLEMHGVEVGDRWEQLAWVVPGRQEDRELVFVFLHYFMAALGAGDRAMINQMYDGLKAWSKESTTQGQVALAVGIPMAEGLMSARGGESAEAACALDRVRYTMDAIGGSAAQRDVFQMIMLDSALKSRNGRLARAWFADRIATRDHSSWSQRGHAAARSMDAT